MRPRAFGWIMYEWFFLLVCLIGVTCFTFTQYLISEGMPGQNRTFIYGFQYQGGLRVLALWCGALALQVQLHDFLWRGYHLECWALLWSQNISLFPMGLLLWFLANQSWWYVSTAEDLRQVQFFLLRSTSRSLVIGENSSMLISSMDFIRYSSRLIANTSDYNSFALGLLGRNSRLSVLAMNSSFPGLYTIFKLYLRSCNNILWSLLGAGSSDFLKMLSVFAESATLVPHNPFVSTWRCLCGSREPLAVKPLQKTKVWTEAHAPPMVASPRGSTGDWLNNKIHCVF